MGTNYLLILLVGFSLGQIFTVLFRCISLRHHFLSNKGVPHIGGISMGISFLISSLAAFFVCTGEKRVILGILIPSLIMLLFGIVDDKKELSIKQKFLTQIIAATLLILFGFKTEIIYIGRLANIVVTFIWVIGITNAFNHLDIMDGLAAGTVSIAAFAFFLTAFFNNDAAIAFLTSALIGIVLSFLFSNFPPAKVYMGNSGSHFLGFILSAIALAINYAPLERKIALLSPVLILGFPIFDTIFVMLMRARKGKSVLMKSNDHLALRLQELGYSKTKTLFYVLAMVLFFAVSGVLLSRLSNLSGLIIIGLVFLLSLLLTVKMSTVAIDG